jgi:hypothetical protein
MKILVLGMPRSRSNLVTSALAKFYGVPNLKEPYQHVRKDSQVSPITDVLLKTQDFVCKLQSSNFRLQAYTEFQYNMYDSIYITVRKNIVDQIASLLVAKTNNAWAHYPREPSSIVFDPDKHMSLLTEIWLDVKKIIILKDQLIKDNIHVKTLYYEISEDWIKNNLNNATTEFGKSNYDYKKIISNYSELEDAVIRHFGELDNRLNVDPSSQSIVI